MTAEIVTPPPFNPAPPPLPADKPFLPFEICGACVSFVFNNLLTILRLGFIPYVLGVGAFIATLYFFPLVQRSDLFDKSPVGELIDLAAGLLMGAIFAVGIHRLVIRGLRPGWLLYLRFRREEVVYILTAIVWLAIYLTSLAAFAAIFAAAFIPLHVLGVEQAPPWVRPLAMFGALVAFWLLIWATLRLALAFPQAAVTGRFGFGASWRAMRGQCWKLFFILLVASILVQLIVFAFLAMAFGAGYGVWTLMVDQPAIDQGTGRFDYGPAAGYAVPSLIVFGVAAYGLMIGFAEAAMIAALSMAYRALVENLPISADAAPPLMTPLPISPAPPPWPHPDPR